MAASPNITTHAEIMSTGYANPYVVAESSSVERAQFIKKTYLHLAGAIGAFALLCAAFLQIPFMNAVAVKMTSGGMSWLIVLGLFMVTSMLADRWARSATSRGMQYAGLGLGVLAQAIIFAPMILMADIYSNRIGGGEMHIVTKAGLITGLMVAGITATALLTKKDFSFLRSFLTIGGFVAVGLIVASIIFKFDLGVIFAGAMVIFASASILYTTSNIQHHYRTDQYVAASLALFAGVALLFWYVLRILMTLASND